MDGTFFCNSPLEWWLRVDNITKFFAFRYTHHYEVSTWFLAGAAGSPVAAEWRDAMDIFWTAKIKSGKPWDPTTDNYFWAHELFTRLYTGQNKLGRLQSGQISRLWGRWGDPTDTYAGLRRSVFALCRNVKSGWRSFSSVFKCTDKKCLPKCTRSKLDVKELMKNLGPARWKALVTSLQLTRTNGLFLV